ncbi:hypothetical protein HUW51_01805 [Adhaeribacter swui]|uniref:Glucosamine/galactosamine-6-phosphate isomerase domain-containing protein n=1 Tax=Adhaeribacter swui TaxID=2086471 RepID=A0A7G7G2Y5_9BACT|nr:hypothetical protein [Adhaeribacter swui]QNF31519.1 hypothetical protein HUW51_01805 [Adhaeribacter swui]
MKINTFSTPPELGKAAGNIAAGLIWQTIAAKGHATIISATGTSQFKTLKELVAWPGVDWKTECCIIDFSLL